MDAASLLFQALTEEFGLITRPANPTQCLQQLYRIRKTDEIFKSLSFARIGEEIWIVKKDPSNDQT